MKQLTASEAEKKAAEFQAITGGSSPKTIDELRQELRHSAHVAELEGEIDNLRKELKRIKAQYEADAIDRAEYQHGRRGEL